MIPLRAMRRVFIGRNGLRAGWRLCIFAALFAGLTFVSTALAIRAFHLHRIAGPLPPWFGLVADSLVLVPLALAALIMARIERRSIDAYGLPRRGAFGSRFWSGAALGFASLSAVIAVLVATHALRLAPSGVPASALVGAALLYGLSFLAVGLTEEFLFRGYAQTTLAQGIGFWPAAGLLSLGFAATHADNHGENLIGVLQIVVYGMVFCYALWRTGTLWLAVGYHAAWDWAQTFVYGVPDSGALGTVSLLHATLAGPAWLSGGSAGPEGSVVTTLMLLALVPIVDRLPHVRNVRARDRGGIGLDDAMPHPEQPREERA